MRCFLSVNMHVAWYVMDNLGLDHIHDCAH